MKINRIALDYQNFEMVVHFQSVEDMNSIASSIIKLDSRPTPAKLGFGEAIALDRELISMMRAGGRINAIKRYKEVTGSYLKEAKDYCDNLGLNAGIFTRDQNDMVVYADRD